MSRSTNGATRAAPQVTGKHWVLLLILMVTFGSAFALIALAVKSIPPVTVMAARLAIAAVMLLAIAAVMRRLPPPLWRRRRGKIRINRDWSYFALLGLIGNVVPFTLIGWGQEEIESSLAGILMAVMPLTTLALASVMLPEETVSPRKIGGFAFGFIGIVILFGPAALGLAADEPIIRQLAIFCGALCYAMNSVLTRRMPAIDAVAGAAAIQISAAIIAAPLALVIDKPWTLDPTGTSLVALVLLAVFPTGLATIVIVMLVRGAGATFTAQINYLVPLWAVMMGFVVLGEVPDLSAFIALAVILTGVALGRSGEGKTNRP